MKRPVQLAIIMGVSIAVAAIVAVLCEQKKTTDMLTKVADEGYETASDVLFPDKRKKQRKQHYGPVI